MLSQLRKYISPATVNLLTYSLANRLYSRLVSNRQEVRFSCELTTKCNIFCDFCTRTRFVEKENPDIICLQETKAHPDQVNIGLDDYKYIIQFY